MSFEAKIFGHDIPHITNAPPPQQAYSTPTTRVHRLPTVLRHSSTSTIESASSGLELPSSNAVTSDDDAVASHAQAAVAIGQKVASATGFFKLDLHTRHQIYFNVLRPDCHGKECLLCYHECEKIFEGCTNVLILSSRTYNEAFEVLHTIENLVVVKPNHASLVRPMKDFPKPKLFYGWREHTPYIPSSLCELHYLRF
jgi:hypothetical protein